MYIQACLLELNLLIFGGIMTFSLPTLQNRSSNIANRKNNLTSLFDDFFNDFWDMGVLNRWDESSIPRLNISESDNSYHIEAELPGIKQENIDLKLNNNILVISGKIEESSEENEKNYYMRERFTGNFQRSVSLPSNVSEDDINAGFKDGILKIDIAKKEERTTKKIEIK